MIDDDSNGCLSQMIAVFHKHQDSIIAIENIDPTETDKYGIVSTEPVTSNVYKVMDIIEKPKPEVAPSSLAVVGRYILTPRIFDLLNNLGKGAGGEIQLTDGIHKLLEIEPVFAYEFSGRRFDCGSKLGYLKAKVNYALNHPEVKTGFAEYLSKIK